MLLNILNQIKTQGLCGKAADDCLSALKFVLLGLSHLNRLEKLIIIYWLII